MTSTGLCSAASSRLLACAGSGNSARNARAAGEVLSERARHASTAIEILPSPRAGTCGMLYRSYTSVCWDTAPASA